MGSLTRHRGGARDGFLIFQLAFRIGQPDPQARWSRPSPRRSRCLFRSPPRVLGKVVEHENTKPKKDSPVGESFLSNSGMNLLCLDAQLLERLGAVVAVGAGIDFLVDLQNLAVLANVKCPPMREWPKGGHHAVFLGRLFRRVAEDGVVRLNRLCKVDVALLAVSGIATGGEVGDVEFSQLFAARTERLALERSAPGKCLGKPGDYHRLFAFVIGELVGVTIAALEREVRGGIADLEVRRAEVRGEDAGGENCREDECYFHFQFVWLTV